MLCSTHIWRFAEPFVIGSVAHGRESKSGRSSRAGGRAQRKTESVLAQDKTTRWLKIFFFCYLTGVDDNNNRSVNGREI